MTARFSLPVPCHSSTENSNNHNTILSLPISATGIENQPRPNTWPSYFQSTVVRLFLCKPIISLPSFLRQDTWSLSSLSDEEGGMDQLKRKSTVSSSLHFPPVPTILWHLHGVKKNPIHRVHLPRLDLESPARSYFPDINKADIRRCSSSIKTFHTQSVLFLFGFLFFPCWWYGWYLSSVADRKNVARTQHENHACCCMSHLHHHGSSETEYCASSCAYPVVTNLYHDIYCYSRFNRFLSFVSFFFLLFILGLLIWLYWGTIHHWWN